MGLGKNGVDWEGFALHDRVRYIKIRRVLGTELEESKSFSHIWEEEISNPEEVLVKLTV